MSKRSIKTSQAHGKRESVFQPEFREDLRYWVETDRKTVIRIFQLIEAIIGDPFQGVGKPEPLKFLGPGVWSRRITQEHRLVYVVGIDRVDFIQACYHYNQEQTLTAFRHDRATQALSSIQFDSMQKGTDKICMNEIHAEIGATRSKRKKMKSRRMTM